MLKPGALSTVSSFMPAVWLGANAVPDAGYGGDAPGVAEAVPGQRDVASVAVDLSPERIQAQPGDLSHGWPAVAAAAVECSETEHQFLQLERLGQVVVGAESESGGLVVKPIGGGEHQDRHATPG